MDKFIVVRDTIKAIRRFGVYGRTLEFKLRPIPADTEPISWVKGGIEAIVKKGTEGLEPNDYVGFTFCSKDFARGQGWLRFKRASEVTFDDIWEKIASIYQSNSTGVNTATFCLGVTTVKMPIGKGRGNKYNSFTEECAARSGIISIDNRDNLCLPRALVVAIAHIDKDPLYTKIRLNRGKIQTKRAQELLDKAQCTIPSEGGGIPEINQLQRYLSNYRITVYQYGSKGRDVVFVGNGGGKKLNLLYHEHHYNVITSLTSAFCCSYYCEDCHIPFDHKKKHQCCGTCSGCQQSPACPLDQLKLSCDICKRSFRGQACFKNHIKHEICEKIYRCEECFKTIPRNRNHVCGEIFCKVCNEHVPQDHFCYIQPDKASPKTVDLLFIFYDLETRQEKQLEDGSLLHEPNLCVFKQACDVCLNSDITVCKKCGLRLQVIKSNDVISPFMHHLLTIRKKFKNVVVIGHNAGGFDHQFLLNYILMQTDLKPELILRGTKIILMEVGNVKFLDSLNYFPMALSKLPKAFGLLELKKGYFPHLFNKLENQNYVGSIPPVEFYDADNMKSDEREKFLQWHADKREKKYLFDFQKEIIEYCISDVEILTGACVKFRQQLLDTTSVCCFTEAVTIASACNKVYRRNFLKPNTIGIIPKNGYRWSDNQSKIAIQWLVLEEKRRAIQMIHTSKCREARIAGVKVDGFCSDTRQVFEFHGCYYHGCPNCYKYNRNVSLIDNPSESLESRYEATVAKCEHLRSEGYEVIEMWECEFRRQLKDEEIRVFTESHPLVTLTPLNPRDAFYGGRTGNTRTYYEAKDGEKIKYVDVCSLYPWVCKYGKFPIGHPKVFLGDDCKNHSLPLLSGIIKCKILPPQNLFHPVLPQNMNNKLMFVLCRTCGESLNEGECNHSVAERELTGTWVIDEVVKALEMGYEIKEIFEIWSYDSVQQFDKATGAEGLFTSMMNKFIKIKQEASGWPKDCSTDSEKNHYIVEFLEREDVQLEFVEIIENPGLRSLAKLMLNSFWGKFGQRENQSKTKIINEPSELFTMLSNPVYTINTLLPVNEKTIIVTYEMIEESYNELSTVNVVIAAYVTALARLKLYSYLEMVGERVLYYDTDSIKFISRPGEPDLPTGKFIGELTDELEGYGIGSYISESVSGGPKNYADMIWSTKDQAFVITCKVKGISLNYNAAQLVNFASIKKMILENSEPIFILTKQIARTSQHEVVTKSNEKMYRPNSLKRKFSEDGTSVPYGFKRLKLM